MAYRVTRALDPLRLSYIKPDAVMLRTSGNRYDIAGAGMLYLGTSRTACFAETLSRYRPSPAMIELLADDQDAAFMPVGSVPQDWRLQRVIARVAVDRRATFVDVDAPETLTYLTHRMAAHLPSLGYPAPLDLSDVHGRDRALTRAIATAIFTERNEAGDFLYDGIKYTSRFGPDWECWAVFEGTQATLTSCEPIRADDHDLVDLARRWGLRVH